MFVACIWLLCVCGECFVVLFVLRVDMLCGGVLCLRRLVRVWGYCVVGFSVCLN